MSTFLDRDTMLVYCVRLVWMVWIWILQKFYKRCFISNIYVFS